MEMYRQMCCLRQQGDGRAEIAGAFGCSVSTVDRAIRMCGEKELKRDSFEEHRGKVLQMYDDGATQAEISAPDFDPYLLYPPRLCLRILPCHGECFFLLPVSHWFPRAPLRQYAQAEARRVKEIRVKVRGRWKTMQDVSDWWL